MDIAAPGFSRVGGARDQAPPTSVGLGKFSYPLWVSGVLSVEGVITAVPTSQGCYED